MSPNQALKTGGQELRDYILLKRYEHIDKLSTNRTHRYSVGDLVSLLYKATVTHLDSFPYI
jgi:hypothetical protein